MVIYFWQSCAEKWIFDFTNRRYSDVQWSVKKKSAATVTQILKGDEQYAVK